MDNHKNQDKEAKQKQLMMELQLDNLMKNLLTSEAKTRLTNIRLVNKEKYFNVVQVILNYYNAGQLKEKIKENELIELLKNLKKEKEFKIRRR